MNRTPTPDHAAKVVDRRTLDLYVYVTAQALDTMDLCHWIAMLTSSNKEFRDMAKRRIKQWSIMGRDRQGP